MSNVTMKLVKEFCGGRDRFHGQESNGEEVMPVNKRGIT
jgi:hypothetical protein